MSLASLAATAGRGFMAKFGLANLKMKMANGVVIQREEIEIQWHRIIDREARLLDELLSVQNFARQPSNVPYLSASKRNSKTCTSSASS
ncbi:MAG: hypothetical protein C4293_20790 [Nitrospiraceae bacterium]